MQKPTVDEQLSRHALLTAIACYTAWGIFPVYWKLLTHIPALETLMHRVVWSTVFYLAIIVVRWWLKKRPWQAVPLREWGICLLCSVLMAVNWGVFIYAVNIEQVVEASLAYFINPLLSVAVGVIIFREAFPKLLRIAFVLAAIGVGIRIGYGDHFPWIAMVLAFSFCIYGAFKKVVKTGALQFSLMESALLTLPALVAIFYLRDQAEAALSMQDWWLLAGGGVITGIPLLLFAMAAQNLPYSVMGMIQFIGPSLQFLIAIIWYKEPLNMAGWVSFAFIWGGVGLYVVDRVRVATRLRKASRIPLAVPEEPR